MRENPEEHWTVTAAMIYANLRMSGFDHRAAMLNARDWRNP